MNVSGNLYVKLKKGVGRLRMKRAIVVFCIFFMVNVSCSQPKDKQTETPPLDRSQYAHILSDHPRIFITADNKEELQEKVRYWLADGIRLLTKRTNHSRIPGRLKNIKNYIYKHAYLYQMTQEDKWAEYAIKAMKKVPQWLKAYGGGNTGFGFALEALSVGYDWCYDALTFEEREYFIGLINKYYQGNIKNLHKLPDFHNYAAIAEFAIVAAGLATYGENPHAPEYLDKARRVMEEGEVRNGIRYCVLDAIKATDGACNWEGASYARHQIFNCLKYVEAWRTATGGEVNLWEEKFSILENAGYYIIYNIRPDGKYENIYDISYPKVSYHDINNMAILHSVFKNPYFTTFLNKHYRWVSGKLETNIWLGTVRAPLIYYLLWYDPEQKEGDLDDLPAAKKFGDVFIMRTGFDENDTFVSFKSGIHWGYHSQLDHGSFTVYKYAPLVIDSGYYDSWRRGREHVWDYWKRSIAHNVPLIYDEREPWPEHPRGNPNRNDGGQRMVFRSFSPPARGKGATQNPPSLAYIEEKWDSFRMGEIRMHEFTEHYDYIKTDITNAYNNKFAGRGNNQPRKADLIQREFIFLKPDLIIVFDRINAKSRHLKKKWLLHSGDYYDKSGKPQLNGKIEYVKGDAEAGIVESRDSDIYTVTEGRGKLFAKTLIPTERVARRIGGEGYEFWVEGENVKLTGIARDRKPENPGAWRIEVEPQIEDAYNEFLHILYVGNTEISRMPQTELIAQNRLLNALSIERDAEVWIVVLNKEEDGSGPIEYTFDNPGVCRQVIFGLKPGTSYRVRKIAKGSRQEYIIKESQEGEYHSSGSGVLTFDCDPKRK